MIESIDFYCASTPTMSRTFDIYMVSTDKSAFTGTAKAADWIPVTADDKVCTKSLLLTQGWNTFELDSPFFYDGTKNIALVICTAADENYENGINFRVFDATSQALYLYNDNNAYDPTDPSEYGGTVSNVKNQIRILKGEVPSCFVPRGLAVSEITAREAELNWTAGGEETAWQICLNGDEEHLIDVTESPYTLTGLAAETTYTVKMRSFCSVDDQSAWTGEISFTTDVACPVPTGLTVDNITPTAAEASWTGEANSYNLRYKPVDVSTMAIVTLTAGDVWQDGSGYQMLLDADATAYGTIIPTSGGLTTSGDASAATYAEFEYKIPVNADGSLTTTNIVMNNSVSILIPAGTYDWCITNPTPGDRMWIAAGYGNVGGRQDDYVFEAGSSYEFTVSLGTNGNDQVDVAINGAAPRSLSRFSSESALTATYAKKTNRSGEVKSIANVKPSTHSYTKLPLEVSTRDEEEWTVVENVTSPYTIDGLTSTTEYEVQVIAVCGGEDGSSEWSNSVYFATLDPCSTPSGLEATNVEATSATLNWTAFLDNYTVRYRTAAYQTTYFEDDFDDDGDASDWTEAPEYLYYWTGSTDYFALLGYTGSQETVNLISPELNGEYEEGSFLYFAYRHVPEVAVPDSAMVFKVGYSTTTDDLEAFTWGDNIMSAYTWTEFEEVIPAGTKYFAIQTTDAFEGVGLVLDYFGVYAPAVEAGEWVEVENATSPLDITGLNPKTWYEWQVQGVNCDGEGGTTEWSASDYFLTPEQTNVTQTIELVAGTNWFSTYVNITLADLKNALVAALGTNASITIKSKEKNVKFQRGRWVGQLTEQYWNLAQMYQIVITSDCEITLEGEPIDPTTLTLNIVEGSNWIAYPYTESTTVADFFGSFAINLDQVKSKDKNVKYRNGRWVGQLTTLVPGQGYRYESSSTTVRPFTFPAAAK
jgi:hypothetical protein